jgi:hypothetical protein
LSHTSEVTRLSNHDPSHPIVSSVRLFAHSTAAPMSVDRCSTGPASSIGFEKPNEAPQGCVPVRLTLTTRNFTSVRGVRV